MASAAQPSTRRAAAKSPIPEDGRASFRTAAVALERLERMQDTLLRHCKTAPRGAAAHIEAPLGTTTRTRNHVVRTRLWAPARRHSSAGSPPPALCRTQSSMGEDVELGPAGEVQFDPGRQKRKTRLGETKPPFADQHGVERVLQPVEVGHVVCRI